MKTSNAIEVKPYTISELADIYEVPLRTFRRWIQKIQHHIGERVGRFYNIKQVGIIFERLGLPGKSEILD